MVHFRTFLAALSAAAAVSAVPVKRTNHESESSGWEQSQGSSEWQAPPASQHEPAPQEWAPAPAHTTPAAHAVQPSQVYGSGSWDKTGYNDCVSQCMAKFGGGQANVYQPPAPAAPQVTEGSVGEGATHTVIVAPSQGVLRYVPAFVNAAVGDTVMFKWGANNHTVTKGSALLPCNKSEDAVTGTFASGLQVKDFTFTQRVNTTEPTYFYCAAPTHCDKGMFGIINPGSAAGSNTSAGVWMPAHNSSTNSSAPASSEYSSYYSYTQTLIQNNTVASGWGADVDMSAVPEWAREPLAENIMYTQNLIAMNPDVVTPEGKISVGTDAPLMLPNDVAAVNNAAAPSGDASDSTDASSAPSGETAPTDPVGAASQNDQPSANGAGALTSSKAVMGAAVVFATYFLL